MSDEYDAIDIRVQKVKDTEFDVYHHSILVGKVTRNGDTWATVPVRIIPRSGKVVPVKIVPETLANPFMSKDDAVMALFKYSKAITEHRNYTQ